MNLISDNTSADKCNKSSETLYRGINDWQLRSTPDEVKIYYQRIHLKKKLASKNQHAFLETPSRVWDTEIISMKFRQNKVFPTDAAWICIERDIIHANANVINCNQLDYITTGGPVRFVSWCPNVSDNRQILAILVSHSKDCHKLEISPKENNDSIQIWDFGNSTQKHIKPILLHSFEHQWGSITSMQWVSPDEPNTEAVQKSLCISNNSPGKSQPLYGHILCCCSDGFMRICPIPKFSFDQLKGDQRKILQFNSDFVLKLGLGHDYLNDGRNFFGYPTCASWNSAFPRWVVAGYSSGHIGIFDLSCVNLFHYDCVHNYLISIHKRRLSYYPIIGISISPNDWRIFNYTVDCDNAKQCNFIYKFVERAPPVVAIESDSVIKSCLWPSRADLLVTVPTTRNRVDITSLLSRKVVSIKMKGILNVVSLDKDNSILVTTESGSVDIISFNEHPFINHLMTSDIGSTNIATNKTIRYYRMLNSEDSMGENVQSLVDCSSQKELCKLFGSASSVRYPLINALDINQNIAAAGWVAVGFDCGIVHLLKVGESDMLKVDEQFSSTLNISKSTEQCIDSSATKDTNTVVVKHDSKTEQKSKRKEDSNKVKVRKHRHSDSSKIIEPTAVKETLNSCGNSNSKSNLKKKSGSTGDTDTSMNNGISVITQINQGIMLVPYICDEEASNDNDVIKDHSDNSADDKAKEVVALSNLPVEFLVSDTVTSSTKISSTEVVDIEMKATKDIITDRVLTVAEAIEVDPTNSIACEIAAKVNVTQPESSEDDLINMIADEISSFHDGTDNSVDKPSDKKVSEPVDFKDCKERHVKENVIDNEEGKTYDTGIIMPIEIQTKNDNCLVNADAPMLAKFSDDVNQLQTKSKEINRNELMARESVVESTEMVFNRNSNIIHNEKEMMVKTVVTNELAEDLNEKDILNESLSIDNAPIAVETAKLNKDLKGEKEMLKESVSIHSVSQEMETDELSKDLETEKNMPSVPKVVEIEAINMDLEKEKNIPEESLSIPNVSCVVTTEESNKDSKIQIIFDDSDLCVDYYEDYDSKDGQKTGDAIKGKYNNTDIDERNETITTRVLKTPYSQKRSEATIGTGNIFDRISKSIMMSEPTFDVQTDDSAKERDKASIINDHRRNDLIECIGDKMFEDDLDNVEVEVLVDKDKVEEVNEKMEKKGNETVEKVKEEVNDELQAEDARDTEKEQQDEHSILEVEEIIDVENTENVENIISSISDTNDGKHFDIVNVMENKTVSNHIDVIDEHLINCTDGGKLEDNNAEDMIKKMDNAVNEEVTGERGDEESKVKEKVLELPLKTVEDLQLSEDNGNTARSDKERDKTCRHTEEKSTARPKKRLLQEQLTEIESKKKKMDSESEDRSDYSMIPLRTAVISIERTILGIEGDSVTTKKSRNGSRNDSMESDDDGNERSKRREKQFGSTKKSAVIDVENSGNIELKMVTPATGDRRTNKRSIGQVDWSFEREAKHRRTEEEGGGIAVESEEVTEDSVLKEEKREENVSKGNTLDSASPKKGARKSKTGNKYWQSRRITVEWVEGKFKGVQQIVSGKLFDEEPQVGQISRVKWSKPTSTRKYPARVIEILL